MKIKILLIISVVILSCISCKDNSTDPGTQNPDVTLFAQSGIDSVIGNGSIQSMISVSDILYSENDSLVLSYDLKRTGSLRRSPAVMFEDPSHSTGEFFPLLTDSTINDYKSFSIGKKIKSNEAGHKILHCEFFTNNDFKAWIKNFKIIKKG